jgi:xanthine phosphoribosyltransferase
MKEKYIPYKTILEYIKILEININESNWNPDLILSINRGGCVPGVFLSHKMGVRHEVYSFDFNRDSKIDILYNKIVSNHTSVLIIDDINDTGNTLSKISEMFKEHLSKLKFAVLINNKSSSFEVDYYSGQIDKSTDNSWIVFPWENMDNE